MLRGPPADALPVALQMQLLHLDDEAVGDGDVDEADGLGLVRSWRAGSGAGDAGDANAERGSGAFADAFGERAGDGVADRAVGLNHLLGDAGEESLEVVGVDDRATEEVTGAAGDGGEAFGEQAAGAAFGAGEAEVAQAEHEQNDLLKRFALSGEDSVVHL